MKSVKYIFVFIVLAACSSDDDSSLDTSLSAYVLNQTIETGAVIACAGSEEETNDVLVFYYPEVNASNIRLYETISVDVDNSDFSNYTRLIVDAEPFFNGYLEKAVVSSPVEKWIIVTYELNNEIKTSNPIRTKQISKPTVWLDNVEIDQGQSGMPLFNWINNQFQDNAIYFQIVSDANDNLLSGTYTFENQFQYYNTSNVVLNITIDSPPLLSVGTPYNFTLMDVSEDNWVNLVILNKSFIAE